MDYNFTAEVEKELDSVANGSLLWTNMLKKFYQPFHKNIEKTLETASRATGQRELGHDPDSGEIVVARLGRFGPMVQIGLSSDDESKKPKFASLSPNQNINSISLEEALELFKFPKNIGDHQGFPVVVAQGKFGPYIKYNNQNISIPKGTSIESVDLLKAIDLIQLKKQSDAPIAEYEGLPVQKGKGRFGPFIKWNEMFINVNRKYDFDNLSMDNIKDLIEEKKRKEIEKYIHRWDEEGISVQKGKWGKCYVVKDKLRIELDKNMDMNNLTLEEVKKIIKDKKSK